MSWTDPDLQAFDAAHELLVTAPRADGSWPPPVPIWVVVTGGEVHVRTWHIRRTGWYGRAVASGRARIGLDRPEFDVTVTTVGGDSRAAVDAAFEAKYGSGGASGMVADEAVRSTLLLSPQP